MRKLFSVLVLFFLYSWVYAQPSATEKEIEKLQKLLKDAEKQARQLVDSLQLENIDTTDNTNDTTAIKFPKPPVVPFPEKIFTKEELKEYLNNMAITYTANLPRNAVAAARQAEIKLGNDHQKIENAAVISWYNGSQNEAVVMAIDAAVKEPENAATVGNLAAILNLGGASKHALPVLQTLVAQFPDNAMFLNNLGQAYFAVGETDKALTYLKRCIAKVPKHPEANNTAGYAELKRGNYSKAESYFLASIKGAYNEGARDGLDKATRGMGHLKLPEIGSSEDYPYFNEFKYKLPRQAQTINDFYEVEQEHEDYLKFINNVKDAYSLAANQEENLGKAELEKEQAALMQKVMQAVRSGKGLKTPPQIGTPVNYAAMRILMDIGLQYHKEEEEHKKEMEVVEKAFSEAIILYENAVADLSIAYTKKRGQYDCGEGMAEGCKKIEQLHKEECKAKQQLANNMLPAISAARQNVQQKELAYMRDELNKFGYYGYLAGLNTHLANAAYYKAAAKYLSKLALIAYDPYTINAECEDVHGHYPPSKEESDLLKGIECPIPLSVNLVVGKLTFDCKKLIFSAGEGVEFNMEKDFVTKQSTMTVSIGEKFKKDAKSGNGIFSGSFNAEATQKFFIIWDGNNKISDAGISFKAELKANGKAEIITPLNIGKKYLSQGVSVNGEFGYTLGINSGWNFQDGSFEKIAKQFDLLKKKATPAPPKKK